MESTIKVYTYPNGEIQRVQIVKLQDWKELDFLPLQGNAAVLDCFCDIYTNYLVPACPYIFQSMIMFYLPADCGIELPMESTEYGIIEDKLTAASIVLKNGMKLRHGVPTFSNEKAKRLWDYLEACNCVRIIRGKMPGTKIIPVSQWSSYLSKTETDARMKVNASFFIMDSFDCASVYDHVGVPFGLLVKDGIVNNPPLYNREALLVKKDGTVDVRSLDVRNLTIEIGGVEYQHGKNASIYTRPSMAKTRRCAGTQLVVVGTKVVAVKCGGRVPIPASGYVLEIADTPSIMVGDTVTYRGLSDVVFGIQVGNSLVIDGKRTKDFISQFYNIYRLERIPYPPCLYPMDYKKARAARIALGADADGHPILIWAEGKGKLSYHFGEDSCGASLQELVDIAVDAGMVNGINLDGGGSAQMLVDNTRMLRISDRNKKDNSDAERLVPLGLVVR